MPGKIFATPVQKNSCLSKEKIRMMFQAFNFRNQFLVALLALCFVARGFASGPGLADPEPGSKPMFRITTYTYGGTGLLLSRVNGELTLMNGGRGSATFNKRYTFGGAGWGMPKGVELQDSRQDTYRFLKMGYGGLEFGYILLPGEKVILGTHLLCAAGAAFTETIPESRSNDFRLFPVLEPAVYGQFALGRIFRLDLGISYRLVGGTGLAGVTSRELSGPSCYIALLAGSCNCK